MTEPWNEQFPGLGGILDTPEMRRQRVFDTLTGLGTALYAASQPSPYPRDVIGPALIGMAANSGRSEESAMRRAMLGMQAQQHKAQIDAMRSKADAQKQQMELGAKLASVFGLNTQSDQGAIPQGGDYYGRTGTDESSNRYDVPNAMGSGAYGKYQFMPQTWADVATANPQLGLPFNMKQATPQQQEAAMQAFTAMNAKALQSKGIQPTAQNLYLAHRFGADGATKFLSADPNTPISQLFPDWIAQNPDLRTTVGEFRQRAQGRYGGIPSPVAGPQVAQGDSMLGPGVTNGPPPQSFIQKLPPEIKATIGAAYARGDIEGGNKLIMDAWKNTQKDDVWAPLSPSAARMMLGPAFDPSKAYQINRNGKVEVIGGNLVNIDQRSEGAFTKQVAEQDAKRLGTIQDNTLTVVDTANKVRMATDMLAKTYTGTGGNYANEMLKALQSFGVPGLEGKTDAAQMGLAIINEITPKMRVPGTGATSDFEMRTFAGALPSMLNTPGGNEKVAAYWERIAQRAVQVQEIAEKYATEKKGLTGTKFAEEVKALGPLFSKDEIAEMQGYSKKKPEAPIDTFNRRDNKVNEMIQRQGQQRRPLESFGGQQ